MLLRTEGQWSPSLLTSLEQFSIGGPASVRGYPVAEALVRQRRVRLSGADHERPGFLEGSGIWGADLGSGAEDIVFQRFRLWAHSTTRSYLDRANASFYGYGTGLAFGIPGELQGRVQYARPFPGAEPTSDGDDDRWWFELTYQF